MSPFDDNAGFLVAKWFRGLTTAEERKILLRNGYLREIPMTSQYGYMYLLATRRGNKALGAYWMKYSESDFNERVSSSTVEV